MASTNNSRSLDFEAAARTQAQMTRAYIADLELQIERLKRHNANYNPEYDPERDEPLDAAWEEGDRAAWRDVAEQALDRLVGEDRDRALLRLERYSADMRREVGELWRDHITTPFPDDRHYLPDVVRVLRRELSEFALADPDEDDDAA